MAARVLLIEIGTQPRAHHTQERPQHTIRIQGRHAIEFMIQVLCQFQSFIITTAVSQLRVKAGFEKLHQQAGNARMFRQQLFHVVLRIRQPGLNQVFGQGTQAHHLTGIQARQQHQSIQAVIFRMAIPALQEGIFEVTLLLGRPQGTLTMDLHVEDLNPARFAITGRHPGRVLARYPQTKIFQCRQHIGQTDGIIQAIKSQAGRARRTVCIGNGQAGQHWLGGRQLRQVLQVGSRLHCTVCFPVTQGKGVTVTQGQGSPVIGPAAHLVALLILVATFAQHFP